MKKLFLILAISMSLSSCLDNLNAHKPINNDKAQTASEEVSESNMKFWTWTTADPKKSNKDYSEEFEKYSQHGIEAVLINTEADADLLTRLVPLAKEHGLEVHAWMFTMNRPGDSVALQHPEWYAVNRKGESTFDNRPYVDYYQWMCPTRKGSTNHVLSLVENLAKVEGVASVHLDYIRLPDIYLPVGLLPKYNLEQEEELPEFDYCYCEVCRAEFEKIHHKDPLDFENPAIDIEWKQFRLNRIKDVVDKAYKIAHDNGKELTAAVFPYPEMADHMVRQRWDKWEIDAVLPMIYHNFYNEELDWIGFATKQGVEDLKAKDVALYTGIYVPPMSATEVTKAIQMAKENGAKGVSFFDGTALTEEQLLAIKAASEEN